MPSVPYRISQVTAVLALVGWAFGYWLSTTQEPHGHPPGWLGILVVMLWVTWILSGTGIICGLFGVRARERRWKSFAFIFIHALLLAWTGFIIFWFRNH